MSWRLAESLKTLRKQINAKFPNRSRISDGSVGDLRHSRSKSDHNPNSKGVVRAVDITHDPANGMDCNKLGAALVNSRDPRIKYLIWNRRIVSSTKSAWKWRKYSGSNGHTKHLHISVNNSNYDDKKNWSLDFNNAAVIHPNPDLVEFGDSGFAVSAIQKQLVTLGYMQASQVDGEYGAKTRQAVSTFQKTKRLDADGIVGCNTRNALTQAVKSLEQDFETVSEAIDNISANPTEPTQEPDTNNSSTSANDSPTAEIIAPDESEASNNEVDEVAKDSGAEKLFEDFEKYGETTGAWFERGSRVSKSSWIVSLGTAFGGILSAVQGFYEAHPILAAAFIVGAVALVITAVWYFSTSKTRDVLRKDD